MAESSPLNEELLRLVPVANKGTRGLVAVLVLALFLGAYFLADVFRPAWDAQRTGSGWSAVKFGWPYVFAEVSVEEGDAAGTIAAIESQPGAEVLGVWVSVAGDNDAIDQVSTGFHDALDVIGASLPALPPGTTSEDPLPPDWPVAPTPQELLAMLIDSGAQLDSTTALPQPAPSGDAVFVVIWRILDCRILNENSRYPLLLRIEGALGNTKTFGFADNPLSHFASNVIHGEDGLQLANYCP